MPDSNMREQLVYIGGIAAIGLGLYLSSLYSYLLFHSLIEITTIAVAFTLFILTWNARKYVVNGYLRLLGIGYAFIALIDLLHTLAYKGMNVFPGYGANLPTQLWIAARYLQAVTLFAAPLFVERRVDNRAIFGIYAAAVSVLLAVVYSGNFPDCFIEGKGLTAFKIGSEYVITALLLTSLYFFYRERKHFNDKVFFLIASSIACTALSEISFTAYLSVYGFANMVGHFSKLAAFYLIYRAILVTGLKEPFDLIFRDLKQAEEALRNSRDTLEEKIRERTAELRDSNEKLAMDLTGRKKAETEREQYFRFFTTSTDLMCIADPDGAFIKTNPACSEQLGYSETELAAKPFIEFVHPDDRQLTLDEMARQLRTGFSVNFENRYICKDGSLRWLSWRAIYDKDEGTTYATARDITERKKAEEELRTLNEELEGRVKERTADLQKKSIELLESQRALMNIVEDLNLKTNELEKANTKLRELDKLKSMFIASMSHELRTPLNSIIGFSSILLDEWLGPLTAEQKENLSIILRSGKHLLSLINDVIDVSKVEAGIIERHVEDFDIFDVISEAVTTFTKDIEEKGLELRVEAVHEHMHTDRRRLLQCVLNLISNAVKFTEKGSITVQTLIREPERADAGNGERMVEISVSDTGIGIREENMPKLCNAFVRLESPLEARVPGTGLGLYLTKKLLAEVLKGEIICISRYAEGSRFAMKVPVRIE